MQQQLREYKVELKSENYKFYVFYLLIANLPAVGRLVNRAVFYRAPLFTTSFVFFSVDYINNYSHSI